ncbi:DNA glycosylase AlkZ-like family protein [Lactococcus cremoris]
MIRLTKEEARNFLLAKQGLLGHKQFSGKEGLMDFVRQAGSVQFDPVDVCGTSPELTLQARIEYFTKEMLDELLYQDRLLIDFFDKNLCILPIEDLTVFTRKYAGISYAEAMARRQSEPVLQMMIEIRKILSEKEYIFAKDLRHLESGNLIWDWGASSSVARAALETMYFKGELIIHHKNGRQKAYALAEKFLSAKLLSAKSPFESELDYHQQLVLRRIGTIGFLWNKRSDAWLGIDHFKTFERNQAFQSLLEDKKITEIQIEGISTIFYMKKEDEKLLTSLSVNPKSPARMEFLAPLDNLLWDRNLIREIFDFDYKWEIYTPKEKRKYGAYVLPVLYKNRFVGRLKLSDILKKKFCLLKTFG